MINIDFVKEKIKKEGAEKVLKEVIENTKKVKNQNFLITLTEKEALEDVKNIDTNKLLSGVPYFDKDNISTKGIRTTGSSQSLDNYIPPYSATVNKRIKDQGAILIGKTALDEFAMGGVGLFSYKGFVNNIYDERRIIGGSSSGSTYAVASGLVAFATGTDTGDSVRKPASYAGIVGYKPTFGSISRYGVFPYAPSLDHVGVLTTNVKDAYFVSSIMSGYDINDPMTSDFKINYNSEKLSKKLKIAYIEQAFNDQKDCIKKQYIKLNEELKKQGHVVDLIKFDQRLLDILESIYMIISFAEAASSHSGIDGVNFGVREKGKDHNQIIENSRGKGFGQNIKKRYILGMLALQYENIENIFNKAKKIRRLICEEIANIFKNYDLFILPASIGGAPIIEDVLSGKLNIDPKIYYLENILGLANMSGMPSITIPLTKCEGLPVGININANHFNDELLCKAALVFEEIIGRLDNE